MSQVNTELGAASTTTRSLGDAAVRALAGLPSGPISFSSLRGRSSAGPVSGFAGTVYGTALSTVTQTTGVQFNTNGTLSGTNNTSGQDTVTGDLWYSPATAGIGSSYWVRATLTGGSTPSTGAMGTWLQLSTAQAWKNTAPGGNGYSNRSSTILFEIAASSGGTVVASGTITVRAEKETLA
jgi:hypothetical protein